MVWELRTLFFTALETIIMCNYTNRMDPGQPLRSNQFATQTHSQLKSTTCTLINGLCYSIECIHVHKLKTIHNNIIRAKTQTFMTKPFIQSRSLNQDVQNYQNCFTIENDQQSINVWIYF